MADSLPLNGSNSKLKTKDSATLAMPSTQANANCVDRHQNDPIKTKKSIKNEKFGKNSALIKESSKTTALISSTSSAVTAAAAATTTTTTTSAPSSISYQQQQKISQTQCQHQNGQKVNIKNMQTAHQDQQTLMDLQEIDDLRKKRCADRYDSSESSDSGVATLSITDSSATSSEDASNPDSPDNSNVVNNDLLHRLNGSRCSKQNQQVPTNNNNSNHNKNEQEMICNAPPLAWPWSVNAQMTAATQQQMVSDPSNASPQPPPLALTKSSILSENKTNCSNSLRNKRNCAQPDNGSHTVNKRNRSSNNFAANSTTNNSISECETNDATNRTDSKRSSSASNGNGSKSSATVTSGINHNISNGNAPNNIRSQTKITGFFKTQMKALPSLRKDLTNMVVRPSGVANNNSLQQKDEPRILVDASAMPATNGTTTTSTSTSNNNSNSSTICSSTTKFDSLPSSTTATTTTTLSNGTAKRAVERKTAKVSPISRKSTTTKKTYANVLPKKHVNIAPRTNATPITVPSMGLSTMAESMKSQQTNLMQNVAQQRLHVKLLKRQMEFGGQTDYGVVPLLTAIHLPASGTAQMQAAQQPQQQLQQLQQQQQQQQQQHLKQQHQQQAQTLGALQANQSLQAQKNLPQTQKPNGAIYQLHPTSVIQIPVGTKDTNTQTANNIVVNNGYFINGAFIKLQQMLAPAATPMDSHSHSHSHFHRQIKESQPQATTTIQNLTEQQLPMSQNSTFAQHPTAKIAPTVSTALVQDPQSLANHNDLTQHFVTNGPSNAQFAQPVFIPTSSGLLLTAALPTMLTSQISNLQPMPQAPMSAATLHSVNGGSGVGEKSPPSIAVSLEKRPCIAGHMQIPQPTLAVALPPDNNMQPNFLPNNFAFGVNAAAPLNQAMVGDKTTQTQTPPPAQPLPSPSQAFNRTINVLSSVTLSPAFNQQKSATSTATNALPSSSAVTFSLSTPPPPPPPPLCVQSKEMVPSSNHHLNLSNPQISFITNNNNSMATQLPSGNGNIMNKISKGIDARPSESAVKCIQNHDNNNKANSKTIENLLDNSNSTDSISNNISTKLISSVRDIRDSQQNDLKPIPAPVENVQQVNVPTKTTDGKSASFGFSIDADSAAEKPKATSIANIAAAATVGPAAVEAAGDSGVQHQRSPEIDTNPISDGSLPESSKSPILSQPKTIRFPANRSRMANDSRTAGCCYWDDCNENCETSSNLLDHLQTTHVNPQAAPFSCRWANCKVHGRESCSRKWLERHVLSHGGSKLFKCIFEKCRMRFGSQLALQKHVNGHINNSENNKDSTVRRSSDPPVPKKLRVNGKRLRYRRQPFSARMFDYFDNGVMEELQHRLLHTVTITNGLSEAITFKGRSVGRRVTANGSVELLIKWTPNDIISDEWMSANKSSFTKTVQLTALTQSERISLMEHLNYLYKFPTNILPSSSSLSNSSCSSSSSSNNSNEHFTPGEIGRKS